ncbi:MAG: hypothetical protein CL917_19030 [Deltaproteobacteria bacterium]|nr:hypothetical protein [Deltaproteobacteria bacterium]
MKSHFNPSAYLPEPMTKLALRLESEGHPTYWVGEDLSRAVLNQTPVRFSFLTTATSQQILKSLPSAVPTRSLGRSFVVPTSAGPVDLAPLGAGHTLEDNLSRRGFTLLGLAWRPADQEGTDVQNGMRDLQDGHLRCMGAPITDLSQAPARALQAACLAAEYRLTVDPSLQSAMGLAFKDQSEGIPKPELRSHLNRLLLIPDPTPGVDLLRSTGIERQLGLGQGGDSARLMALSPIDLGLRWMIWLRNGRGTRPLRKLGTGLDLTRRIQNLLAAHPIEERFPQRRGRSLRKWCARLGDEDCEKLVELRKNELKRHPNGQDSESQIRLKTLIGAIAEESAEIEAGQKAIKPLLGGREIMDLLNLPPGPEVGAALLFMKEKIESDPTQNNPSTLTELLKSWAAEKKHA